MKNKIMRIAIMLCLFVAIIPAKAQSDLQINIVFERFGKAKNCKMVVLNDAVLRGYKLKVYKALTYKKIGASIAPYLNSDRKKARKIREIVVKLPVATICFHHYLRDLTGIYFSVI